MLAIAMKEDPDTTTTRGRTSSYCKQSLVSVQSLYIHTMHLSGLRDNDGDGRSIVLIDAPSLYRHRGIFLRANRSRTLFSTSKTAEVPNRPA